MRILLTLVPAMLLAVSVWAAERGGRVQYIGGTVAELADVRNGRIFTSNDDFLLFESKKAHYLVPWDRINLLEYGQKVSRRYALGVVISPLLLLSKSRKHYLTIGFTDEEGKQQAMVFRVNKNNIRPLLVSLEARANLNVEYQDEEARRAGKG